MPSFSIEYDGDLWIVRMDGKLVDGFNYIDEACQAVQDQHSRYLATRSSEEPHAP